MSVNLDVTNRSGARDVRLDVGLLAQWQFEKEKKNYVRAFVIIILIHTCTPKLKVLRKRPVKKPFVSENCKRPNVRMEHRHRI